MTAGPPIRPEVDDFDSELGEGPVPTIQAAALRRARFAGGGEPELSLAGALEFVDAAEVESDAFALPLVVCALVGSERAETRTATSELAAPMGPIYLGAGQEAMSSAAVGAAVAYERYGLSLAEAAELGELRPEAVERAVPLLERS